MRTEAMDIDKNNMDNVRVANDTPNLNSSDIHEDLFGDIGDARNIIFSADASQILYNGGDNFPHFNSEHRWIENLSESGSNTKKKPSIFDSDEVEKEVDLVTWTSKRKDEWEITDTVQWLLWAGTKLKQPYGQMSPELAVPGKVLVLLSIDNFIQYDEKYGERLYALLHKKRDSKTSVPKMDALKLVSDDDTTAGSEFDSSDGEIHRPPGRPRIFPPKTKEPRVKLWEFLRNSLADPNYSPGLLCWEDYKNKVFRLTNPHELAKIWGERAGKNPEKDMTYGNFSRAMRYYYKQGILKTVPKRRLVYQFGEKVTGFITECSSLDPSGYGSVVKSEF